MSVSASIVCSKRPLNMRIATGTFRVVASTLLFAFTFASPVFAGGQIFFFDGEAAPDDSYLNPLNWAPDDVPSAPNDATIGTLLPPGISPALVTIDEMPPEIGTIRIGANGGVGEVNHFEGDLIVFESFFLGSGDNSSGIYQLGGTGSIKLEQGTDQFFGVGIGDFAQGQLTINTLGMVQSQRTVIGSGLKGFGQIALDMGMHLSGPLLLGSHNDAFGIYQVAGGELLVENGLLTIGDEGQGLLTASNQAIVRSTGGAIVGRQATNEGQPTMGRGVLELIGGGVTMEFGRLAFGHDCDGIGCMQTDAEGTLRYISQEGVSVIDVNGDVLLNNATLDVDLEKDPVEGDVLLIDLQGDVTGQFMDINGVPLPEGAPVPNSGGRFITYDFFNAGGLGIGAGQGGPTGIGLVTATIFESDFDKDGDVDGDDFLIWQSNFGQASTARNDGDADDDGDVDGQDFLIWQAQFGMMSQPPGTGFVHVPEPASLAILVIGAGLASLRNARRPG